MTESNQLLFARQIGVIMKSSNFSNIGKLMSRGFVNLPIDTLHYIAVTGPLSRVTLEVILDNDRGYDANKTPQADLIKSAVDNRIYKNEQFYINLISTLYSKLSEKIFEIAVNFIGQHVFRKLFNCCKLTEKEDIILKLIEYKEKLQANKPGREAINLTNMELYIRKRNEWLQLINRQIKANNMINQVVKSSNADNNSINTSELKGKLSNKRIFSQNNSNEQSKRLKSDAVNVSAVSNNNNSDSSDNIDHEDALAVVDDSSVKKKRKRKRQSKKRSDNIE